MSADHFEFRASPSQSEGGFAPPIIWPPEKPTISYARTTGEMTDDLILLDVQPLARSDPDKGQTPEDIIIWDIDGDGEGFYVAGMMFDLIA